jgi:hypothetical protein
MDLLKILRRKGTIFIYKAIVFQSLRRYYLLSTSLLAFLHVHILPYFGRYGCHFLYKAIVTRQKFGSPLHWIVTLRVYPL